MKASVYLGPERVELRDIEVPQPGDSEALIKVARAGLCGTDLHIYQGHMDQRVQIPLVMGHEMCGEIVEVAKDAAFKVGDRVVVEPTVACGACAACRRGASARLPEFEFFGDRFGGRVFRLFGMHRSIACTACPTP